MTLELDESEPAQRVSPEKRDLQRRQLCPMRRIALQLAPCNSQLSGLTKRFHLVEKRSREGIMRSGAAWHCGLRAKSIVTDESNHIKLSWQVHTTENLAFSPDISFLPLPPRSP